MKQALETLLRELAMAAAEDGATYGVPVLDAMSAGWQALAAATTTEVETGAASMREEGEGGVMSGLVRHADWIIGGTVLAGWLVIVVGMVLS